MYPAGDLRHVARIIGCGRWSMGNDQAGLLVARRLHERGLPDAVIDLSEQPAIDLAAESHAEAELLIVVDTARADDVHPIGTFVRFDYREGPRLLDAVQRLDSHSLGVAAGLELAERLGMLPPQVWIYVLFCGAFERRLTLDAALDECVAAVAAAIERDLVAWRARRRN